MNTFITNQFDFIFFLYGLAFAILATICFSREGHGRRGLPWFWLGCFGMTHAGHEWLEGTAFFYGDMPLNHSLRLMLLLASYLCLGEFGRSGLRNLGRKVPGAWVLLIPAVLAGAAFFYNRQLAFILTRGLAGFPLALLAAAAFWNFRRHQPHRVYPWVILATGTMVLYALVSGLPVYPGATTVEEYLTHDPLFRSAGIPLILTRTLLSVLLVAAVWGISHHERPVEPGIPDTMPLSRIWPWGLLLLLLLAGGWLVTEHGGRSRDWQKRQLLLTQARMVAAAWDPQQIARLTGTRADLENPFYRVLKKRLVDIAAANAELRFAYLVGSKDGAIVFQAVSEAENSRDYVPPGHAYTDADPAFLQAFTTGRPFISGPYRDRWGTWITAGVPLRHPETRQVFMLTCLDMQAGDWQADIARKRLLRIAIIWPFCILLLTIFAGFQRNAGIATRIAAGEKRFKTIFDSVQDAITIHNLATGDVLEANDRAYAMLGYQPGEIPASQVMPFNAHEPPFDSLHADQWIRKAASGEPQLFEWQTRHRSGRMFWIEVHLKRAMVGHRERLLAVVRDIDTRKRAEEELRLSHNILEQKIQERTGDLARANAALQADLGSRQKIEAELRESENRFRTLVETNAFGIMIFENERILYVNPGAERISGYNRTELLRMTYWETVHPEFREQIRERGLARQRGEKVPDQYSVKIITCNQQSKWIFVSVGTVRYNGKPAILVYFLDISELKQLEEERTKLNLRLLHQRKLESLGAMAGGIAHDFNNLLMSVLGNADLIRLDTPAQSPLQQNLDDIILAAQRAASIAEKMLIYAGRGDFRPETVDTEAFLKSLLPFLANFASAKIDITFNLAPRLSHILADLNQIRQIIVNLVTNAAEAIGENPGIITFSAGNMFASRQQLDSMHLGEGLVPGHYVFIEVTDTGAGMDAETRNRIFDPFFTTKFIGRGLGLPAVLGIVKFHLGAIRVDSDPGRGTAVRILFPAQATPASAYPPGNASPPATVLIMDEDETLLHTTRQAFNRAGFDVVTATDREGALFVFTRRAQEIKAVVLDVPVPGVAVSNCLERFRLIAPELPVLLTGSFTPHEACCGLAADQMTDYVQKPYQPENLVKRIQALLGTGRTEAPADGPAPGKV